MYNSMLFPLIKSICNHVSKISDDYSQKLNLYIILGLNILCLLYLRRPSRKSSYSSKQPIESIYLWLLSKARLDLKISSFMFSFFFKCIWLNFFFEGEWKLKQIRPKYHMPAHLKVLLDIHLERFSIVQISPKRTF